VSNYCNQCEDWARKVETLQAQIRDLQSRHANCADCIAGAMRKVDELEAKYADEIRKTILEKHKGE